MTCRLCVEGACGHWPRNGGSNLLCAPCIPGARHSSWPSGIMHYPRQMSLGHVTFLQTRNSPFYKVSSESWQMSLELVTFLQTRNSLFYKVSSESAPLQRSTWRPSSALSFSEWSNEAKSMRKGTATRLHLRREPGGHVNARLPAETDAPL